MCVCVCIPCQLLSLRFITYNVHSSHGFLHLVLISDIHMMITLYSDIIPHI